MTMPAFSPNGQRFSEDDANDIIRSSEAAFEALRRTNGDPEEWQARNEFAKRFSGHVAAPLTLGYGFVVPPAESGDAGGRAAVRLVELAREYWQAENQIYTGHGDTLQANSVIECMHRRAGLLSRDSAEVAATGAAVCHLLRGIFTRFGIPADDLTPCTCAAPEAPSAAPADAVRRTGVATATAAPIVPAAHDDHRKEVDGAAELQADGSGTQVNAETGKVTASGTSPAWVSRCGGAMESSPDFAVVKCGGKVYKLSNGPKAVLTHMVGAFEAGRNSFTKEELIEAAGSSSSRAGDAVGAVLWNRLVVPDEGHRGRYRLVFPPAAAGDELG